MNCKRRDCGVSARAIVNTCGWGFVVLVVRGRSVGGRGVVVVARLLVGEYGYHVLVEEVVEGHRLVAVWTWAADVDSAGEDAAGWAALFTEETVTAGGALVDGELAAWPGGGGGDGGQGLLVASAKRGLAAGWAAVGLPAGRGEGLPAERAGPRRGIVPRRAGGLLRGWRPRGGGWPVHQAAASASVAVAARSTRRPLSKRAPARTSATSWGALTARHRAWAASMSLNAMARPAAFEPGPLVTLVR